jgi:hypothetical protein
VIRVRLLAVWLALAWIGPTGRSVDPPWIAIPVAAIRPPVPSDPFPIRRIFLPSNRTPDGIGSLVRLPRDEFERKVRTASEVVRNPPQIAAAHYTATFTDGVLAGTAEWTIRNPGGKRGLLALDPHRLALTRPRAADGNPVRFIRSSSGDDTPRTFAWLDGATARDGARLVADWSLRASGDSGEPRFEFRVPPAGIAFLTLTLPTGVEPRVSADEAVVSGPLPADQSARQRWRIAFGGRSTLDLAIVPFEGTRTARPGPVRTTARWTVGDGRAEGTFRFDLDPAHEPGDAYVLEVDHRLIVQSVTADIPVDWQNVPSQAGSPATIRIGPRDTGRIGRILVAAASNPPVPGESWTVPSLRLRDSLPAEATVHMRIAPDLRPLHLDPGDFRLIESDLTDAGRSMTWTSTLARPDSRVRLGPTFSFAVPQAETSVSERATFTVGQTDCFLRVLAAVTVVRGPVSTLSFLVPEPYHTTVAPSVANDPLATARLEETKPARWTISLSRPLATGQSTSVMFSLAGPLPAVHDGVIRVAVPAVDWPSSARSGTATVTTSPEWMPVSPLVVAYQDLPPSGELFLRRIESGSSVESSQTTSKPANSAAGTVVDLRPDHGEARIGDHTISYRITGMTAGAGDRSRVRLPAGATVRSVRVDGRAIDRPRIDSGELVLPPGVTPAMPFEIEFDMNRLGSLVERIHATWPDGSSIPVQWTRESNWFVAPRGAGESVDVVRRDVVIALGWLLAACLLVPLHRVIAAGPSSRSSLFLLFVAAAVCGTFAAGRLAGPAFVAPLIVSLAGLVFVLLRKVPSAVVVVVLLGVPADAAGPQPVDVFLMYGTGEESETLFVYASKALLDRLDRLTGTAEPEAAILSAFYAGAERPDEATIRAEWVVSVPPGGPHRLNVPLSGAKLESVTLDGMPAFPEPIPPGGFSLTLTNQGSHTVSATFAVPVRLLAGEREIRFSGPDVALNSLEFMTLHPASRIDVTTRRGRQTTFPRDGRAVTMAELGEGRTVAVRWRDRDVKPGKAASDTTLEAAVWDVEESEATLTAAFQFPANHGPEYRIIVPTGLSLVRATARPADGGSPVPMSTMRTGEKVVVTLRQPVEGKVTIVLAFVSDRPLTALPRFPFPRSADRPDPSAVYAIRLNGLAATEFGRNGAIDVPADAAARAAILFPELNLDVRPATRAYRRTADVVTLAPRLAAAPANPLWTGTATWTLGKRADVLVEWRCDGAMPGQASFALPPVMTLAGIRGPDVIDTTIADGVSTLWLRTGDDPGPIRLVGTMAVPPNGDCSVPAIRPPNADKAVIRIRPAAGFSVRVPPATGVTSFADGTYELAPGVDSLRVAVTAIDPPKPSPQTAITAPATAPVRATDPLPAQTTPVSPGRSPPYSIPLWLGGLVSLGLAFVPALRFAKPELILVWGALAWVSWSPLAVAGVAIGIAMRVVRTLHEAPSPAR